MPPRGDSRGGRKESEDGNRRFDIPPRARRDPVWAVNTTVAGVSINTIGVILLVVGAIGLVAGLLAASRTRDDRDDRVAAP